MSAALSSKRVNKHIFCQIGDPYLPLYPYARDRRNGQIVRLPDEPLKDESETHYKEVEHKGHLTCSDCKAPVHYQKKTCSGGGNNTDAVNEHWATNPGAFHDIECEIRARRRSTFRSDIVNHQGPIQITLNALDKKHQRNAKYDFRKESEIKPLPGTAREWRLDPKELRTMERVAVSSAKDMDSLLRRRPLSRIFNGVVRHFKNQIQTRHFIVTYDNKGAAFRNLVSALYGGRQLPVYVEVRAQNTLTKDSNRIISESVHLKREPTTRLPAEIIQSVYIDTKDEAVRKIFEEPNRRVFVLGFEGLNTVRNGEGTTYHLSISVTDASQIVEADFSDVKRLDKKKLGKPKEAGLVLKLP